MRRRPLPPRTARRGFTLVEVLIVVVILGILAATIIPQFSAANDDAKYSALKQNLQQLRTQIDLYTFQHNNKRPTAASFVDQMTQKTKYDGTVDAAGAYGPYVLGTFPTNPFNELNTVAVTATNPKDGTTGWWYNEATGEFRANETDNAKAKDGTTLLNSL